MLRPTRRRVLQAASAATLSGPGVLPGLGGTTAAKGPPGEAIDQIKAYCLDFNWGPGGPNAFARPGLWAEADPAEHAGWYQALGANVIQSFCVSCNGYAWYKGGPVPEQPGLKHDFLPELVQRGHERGMHVMGYFCIGANTRWGKQHPELSYGHPSTYHIPYTDAYLEYLATVIDDAVRRTGIDGFMIDWLWQPRRRSTDGQWLACEKRLYQQLMGEPFPGENELSAERSLAYSRKAIARCWRTIHRTARNADPDCVLWLTVNDITHPHVVRSPMYKQADWLMNEAGDMEGINKVRPMIGEDTRLITCLANWNDRDATEIVPKAMEAGVGLYGFAKPEADSLRPLEPLLKQPVDQFEGDQRNIAVLARAYHGAALDTVRNEAGRFVRPDGE